MSMNVMKVLKCRREFCFLLPAFASSEMSRAEHELCPVFGDEPVDPDFLEPPLPSG
jgi:hypothetical protein